jgi:TolB-like protein
MPFDVPDHIETWAADDTKVLETAILTATQKNNRFRISAAPRGTETPRDRAAIAKAGRALGADYLLEGGITEFGSAFDGQPDAGSVLQITFQLFDGRSGALVWVDEANATSAASSRAASVRALSDAVARVVAARLVRD